MCNDYTNISPFCHLFIAGSHRTSPSMFSCSRLRVFVFLLTVFATAAWPYPFGDKPDGADDARRGKESLISGSPFAHPSLQQYEFDPDFLRLLLSNIEAEATSHHHHVLQNVIQYHGWQPFHADDQVSAWWHHANQPTIPSQPDKHVFRSFQPDQQDQGQAGSSRVKESVPETQSLLSNLEPAPKRQRTMQRVAEAFRHFNTNGRLEDVQALKSIIQRPQIDVAAASQAQAPTKSFQAAFSSPIQDDLGRTFHRGPPTTNDVDTSADRPETHTTAERSHKSPHSMGEHYSRGNTPRPPEMDELRNLPVSTPPLQRSRDLRHFYQRIDDPTIRELINSQIFAGKLVWIDKKTVPPKKVAGTNKLALHPSRILPLKNLPEIHLPDGHGTIRDVRVTLHGGRLKHRVPWPEGHPLIGQNFYAFWGIPEVEDHQNLGHIHDYGIAYLPPQHRAEVNSNLRALRKEIADKAREATRLHA